VFIKLIFQRRARWRPSIRSEDDEATASQPRIGIQGESGAGPWPVSRTFRY